MSPEINRLKDLIEKFMQVSTSGLYLDFSINQTVVTAETVQAGFPCMERIARSDTHTSVRVPSSYS